MLAVTFLGHQGWMFASETTRILVDPLLTEEFCDAGRVGRVFPPRRLDLEAFPTIDAVFFSHEHNDHFAIPTLARLDRRIPIYLSARSSRAARAILEEMGFGVRLVAGGSVTTVGDLEIHAFASEHADGGNVDEWDVFPYLVRDRAGDGSFFTSVDVDPTERLEDAARAVVETPGLWCYTNNLSSWSFMDAGEVVVTPPADTLRYAEWILGHHMRLRHRWADPAGVLFAGGGMAFDGERAWLNRNVFRADSERVVAALRALLPGQAVIAPTPGHTTTMMSGGIARTSYRTEFLESQPRDTWPAREHLGDVELLESYEPASGVRELTLADVRDVEKALEGFARFLHGGATFRALYSLDARELANRRPTFALVLRDGAGGLVYEYDPAGCRFVPARSADPVGGYVSGLELWGSDLLAIARGELGATAVPFGRGRRWNAMPGRCTVSFEEMWMYFHPLRDPELHLRLYRNLLAREPKDVTRVRARE